MSHILPEDSKNVPLAEIIFMIGFFIIYFIEEVVDYFFVFKPDTKDNVENKPEVGTCLEIQQKPKTFER